MKVVAEMGDSKLMEVSKDELAVLLGYRNQWDDSFRMNQEFPIGRVVDICKFAKVSESIKNLNTGLLKASIEQLDKAHITIVEAMKTIDEINCFEKLKGNE